VESVTHDEGTILVQIQLGALSTKEENIGAHVVDDPTLVIVGTGVHLAQLVDRLQSELTSLVGGVVPFFGGNAEGAHQLIP